MLGGGALGQFALGEEPQPDTPPLGAWTAPVRAATAVLATFLVGAAPESGAQTLSWQQDFAAVQRPVRRPVVEFGPLAAPPSGGNLGWAGDFAASQRPVWRTTEFAFVGQTEEEDTESLAWAADFSVQLRARVIVTDFQVWGAQVFAEEIIRHGGTSRFYGAMPPIEGYRLRDKRRPPPPIWDRPPPRPTGDAPEPLPAVELPDFVRHGRPAFVLDRPGAPPVDFGHLKVPDMGAVAAQIRDADDAQDAMDAMAALLAVIETV